MPADYNKLIQEDAAHRVQRAMGDDEDYSGLAVEAPVTARFLEEHPVKDNLAELEKLAKSRSSTPKIFQGLGSAVAAQFEKGLRGLDVAVKDSVGGNYVPSNFAVDESMAFTLNEQMREDIGSGEESIAQQLENIRLLDKRVEELTPQDMSIVEEGIRSGVESLAMMSPGLLASVATRSSVPMLGSLTAQTGFASYAEGRSEGLTPEQATAYAGIDAAIEFVTEKIPADKLVDMMPGGKEMLKKALRFLVAEGVGEQVATLGQSLNALAFDLDEQLANATPEEAVEIQARRQAVTFIATLVAGGAQAGAIGTLGKISEKLSGSAAITEADADHLDKLVQAANVPLKTSDPQVFMQHLREVQEQYGEENVYIDAAVVSQALADVETFDQAVMALVDQAASAEAVGGDVVVPIEVYATYLSQYHEQLSPHVRLTPDSMTQAELESGEVQNGLDRLMAEAEAGVDHSIAVQAIREKYADQLVATGRYDYQSANQAASLISEYASAQAQRRGITPDQVMEEMNLSIEGPGDSNAPLTFSQIEEAENAQAAAKGLDMSTEARMARAREMGFTLDVFHSTHADYAEVDESMVDLGLHVGTQEQAVNRLKDTANPFAQGRSYSGQYRTGAQVMPLKARVQNPLELPDVGQWNDSTAVLSELVERNSFPELEEALLEAVDVRDSYGDVDDWLASPENRDLLDEAKRAIQEAGYDSVRYKNQVENDYGDFGRLRPEVEDRRREINDELFFIEQSVRDQHEPRIEDILENTPTDDLPAALDEWRAFKVEDYYSPEDKERIEALRDELFSLNEGGRGEVDTFSYIILDPSNIRSINAAFDPEFSDSPLLLAQPAAAEPQKMQALHNLSAENLRFADEIGGLAVPSIGVVNEGMGIEGMGEITLIGRKDLADPEINPVFDADAYTATFPRPDYKKVPSKKAQALVDEIRPWNEKYEGSKYSGLVDTTWDYAVNNPDPQKIISDWMYSNVAKGMFASEVLGKDVDVVETPVALRYEFVAEPWFKDAYEKIGPLSREMGGRELMETEEYAEFSRAVAENLAANAEKYLRMIPEWGETATREEIQADPLYDSLRLADIFDENGRLMFGPYSMMGRSYADVGKTQVDRGATQKAVDEAIVGSEAKFQKWVSDKVLAIFDLPRIKVGGKLQPYTLDNIVRVMTGNRVKAQENTMTFGSGNARAAAATRFKNLEKMREQAAESVKMKSDLEAARKEADEQVSDWRDSVLNYYGEKDWRGNVDTWGGLDASMRALSKTDGSANKLAAALRREGFNSVPDRVVQQGVEAFKAMLTAPVPYFEAKPQRAVGLGEFAGAVVPDDVSRETLEILDKHGIPHITYGTRYDEQARADAVAAFSKELAATDPDILFQKERAKIEIFPDRAIIRLGEASDLSSFLHEAGHLFLEMERRRGDSPDQQKILEWLGVDSWDAIGVDQHEQWARGFEAYLFEGQAPSLELREAFRRFAQWLKRIYRTIKGLDVELTDDIRAVMDRMLATDEQIEIAQRENEYVPLFRDAKSAGMSAEEWQDYLERQAKATDRANETLTQKLAKQYRRQTERWWKDELASEIEASKEILLEGPHGAYETIRGNVDTDNPVKLHRGTVDQLLGIERPQKIKSDPNKVDERYDSLLVAIAKSGGLDRAQAEEYGIDPDYWTGKNGRTVNRPVFGKILFKADGRELDMVRENMSEYGYLAPDSTPADLLDLIDAELRGQPQYSVNADYVALYGQEQDIPKKHLPYNLRGLVAEDGASPDDVAARFGYASGAEMIQEFANLPSLTKAAKEQAESRMRDKYGDILNDGTIEQEAQKAAHSEERGRLLFHELRALSRKAPPIDRESLKASARGVIGRTPIKDIRPDQYRKAEVRAARRAQSAMDAGDRDGAKKFKTQQLANFYLWKEATRARERSEAIRKRLQATQARKIKKIDPEYNRHIKLLLAAYDFTTGKLKNTNKARMVANWAKSQFRPDESIAVQMLDPNLEKILEADRIGIEPNLQAHRGMTLDDLEGLDQMVRHLRFIGGRLSESEKEARRIAHQKVGQSILDHAKPLPVEGSLRDRAQGALKEFGSSVFLHADSVLRALDGFDDGPAYQAIKRPIDEAVTQKLLPMQEQAGKDIAELYDQHYTFKELRANNKAQAVAGREMSKWQMISLALNWGNQSSREAVLASTLGGEQKWTQEQVSEVLDRLDKRDWQFVQGVWDYIDTYWSKVAEVERKRNGVVPPKVEAVPVETRYGIMRGGYYPLKYDSEKSVKVSQQEADELMSHITSGAMAKAAAKDGFTKARVGSGGRPVLLEIDVFHRHINESIQFIAMTEAVANVNAVLSSQEVKVAAEATGNQAAIKNLDMWLRDAAVGEVLSGDVMSKVFRNLRTGFSAMSIGWNVGTIMMQPLGLLQSLPVIGYGNMAKGVRAFVSAPGETMRRVQEMSVFMRERGATFNKDIRDTLSALHGDPNKPTFIPEKVRQSFFAGIVYTQRFVDTITWLGTYEGTKGKPESDRIYAADRSVARSQASGIWSDRTPIERGTISRETRQSEWVRMWTALGSYFFAKGNIAQERYRATDFKSPVQASRFVADMLVLFTVEALLVGMLRGTMPDEEDDESKLAFAAKETGLSVMASIPFVREVGSVLAGFGGAPTYTTAAKSVADVGVQLGQAENDAALWKSINNLGGMLFKYPSRQINRTVGTFIDDINGEDVDLIDYLMWREK